MTKHYSTTCNMPSAIFKQHQKHPPLALPKNGAATVPTYEYKCQKCGHDFEEFQNMSDKPLSACPQCGGKVQRLMGTGAAVIFKGSGFYATDYGRQVQPSPRCGRNSTCCGQDVPCDTPPCND